VKVWVPFGRAGGLTEDDVELTRSISLAARDLGLAADPSVLQTVELVIETARRPALASFWQNVLGYEDAGPARLTDPARRGPGLSLRQSAARPVRDRIHLDVIRPPDVVMAARQAVAQEPFGAYGVALADADGNEVDLVPGNRLSEGPETSDWQVVFAAMAVYPVDSPRRAADLASVVARLADEAGLPLMVDVRADGVTIDGGKDQWDDGEGSPRSEFLDLAVAIQAAARHLGLWADPTQARFVQLGMDAVDVPSVRAFWAAVLGYEDDPRPFVTDIYDPRRLGPVLFFQSMDGSDAERRQHRNRLRLRLVVPDDGIQGRLDAAVAAGGRVVAADPTTGGTVADPEGNVLEIVTAGHS
jgi:hypothetical protein